VKKSCLVLVGVFAALFGGYWWLFHGRVESPADLLVALLGAVFSTIAVSSLWGVALSAGDALALGRARAGVPFADGRQEAAAGPIHPLGEPLRSPFGGQECAAYEYEAFVPGGGSGGEGKKMAFSGFGLTPSVIATPRGDVRLLAYPMLEHFPPAPLEAAEARARAENYFSSTRVEPIKRLAVGKLYAQMKDLLTDDDGAVRKDLGIADGGGGGVADALSGCDFQEKVVEAGAAVCALGHYSAARGGLAPDLSKATGLVRLVPGDLAAARRVLVGGAWRTAGAGLFFFLAFHAILIPMLLLSGPKLSAEARAHRNDSVHYLAQEGEVAVLDELLAKGTLKADERDAFGQTALSYTRDPAVVAVLLRHGADPDARDSDGDTLLMEAARAGNADLARTLVAGGADVNAFNRGWGRPVTALTDAVESGHQELVDLLLAAGAKSDYVSAANGQPLPAGGGEPFAVVAAYLAAIQRGDAADLDGLVTGYRPGSFADADFDLWRRTRPASPVLVAGWVNGADATLEVAGPSAAGQDTDWLYQLRRVPASPAEAAPGGPPPAEVWRITREWEKP
jgi:uncharacterized protein